MAEKCSWFSEHFYDLCLACVLDYDCINPVITVIYYCNTPFYSSNAIVQKQFYKSIQPLIIKGLILYLNQLTELSNI